MLLYILLMALVSLHIRFSVFLAVVYIITVSMSKIIFAESTLDLVPLLQPL